MQGPNKCLPPLARQPSRGYINNSTERQLPDRAERMRIAAQVLQQLHMENLAPARLAGSFGGIMPCTMPAIPFHSIAACKKLRCIICMRIIRHPYSLGRSKEPPLLTCLQWGASQSLWLHRATRCIPIAGSHDLAYTCESCMSLLPHNPTDILKSPIWQQGAVLPTEPAKKFDKSTCISPKLNRLPL